MADENGNEVPDTEIEEISDAWVSELLAASRTTSQILPELLRRVEAMETRQVSQESEREAMLVAQNTRLMEQMEESTTRFVSRLEELSTRIASTPTPHSDTQQVAVSESAPLPVVVVEAEAVEATPVEVARPKRRVL